MKAMAGVVLIGSAISLFLLLDLSFAKARDYAGSKVMQNVLKGKTLASSLTESGSASPPVVKSTSTKAKSNPIEYNSTRSTSTRTETTNTKSNTSENEETVIGKLSDRYQVQKNITRQLRQELGSWYEVATALVIAQRARVRADHILSLKKNNMSWDQIMESYTINKNDVRDEVISLMREIEDWKK